MSAAASKMMWGAYQPKGLDKLILLPTSMGLGRGKLKRVVNRLWLNRHRQQPVDIDYHGLKLRLHPWDNTIESKILFSSRLREADELRAIEAFVDQGAFVDIGANAGYYSLMAAKQGFKNVLAFEPNPLMFERLKFNAQANGFEHTVSALQLALGDQEANIELAIAPAGDMGGTRVARIDPSASTTNRITVPMRSLLSVLNEQSVDRIGAMKIDVEGFEDAVLFPFFESAPRTLWPKLVIIEHTSQQDWSRNILGWMLDHGYREQGRTKGNAMLVL